MLLPKQAETPEGESFVVGVFHDSMENPNSLLSSPELASSKARVQKAIDCLSLRLPKRASESGYFHCKGVFKRHPITHLIAQTGGVGCLGLLDGLPGNIRIFRHLLSGSL